MLEAVGEVFPEAQYQRCTVHFYRNMFSVTPRSKVKLVAKMLTHVILMIAIALCIAQSNTINDACVIQVIRNHSILGVKQRFEQTAVCVKTRGIQNAVVHAK